MLFLNYTLHLPPLMPTSFWGDGRDQSLGMSRYSTSQALIPPPSGTQYLRFRRNYTEDGDFHIQAAALRERLLIRG